MRLPILLNSLKLLVFSLVLSCGFSQIATADNDDHVIFGGAIEIDDDDTGDIVAIGGEIEVGGNVSGDVVTIGGQISFDANVQGDMMALGGEIEIDTRSEGEIVAIGGEVTAEGITTDSAVVIGGDLIVELIVGDELVVTGGQIAVGADTNVAGNARIFGADVSVDGIYSGDVKAGGAEIAVNGQFSDTVEIGGYNVDVDGYFGGDVVIEVDQLEFGDSVQFLGDLTIRSPREPELPEGLTISGNYTYEKISRSEITIGDAEIREMLMVFGFGAAAILILTLLFVTIALAIVAGGKKVSSRGVQMIRDNTVKSLLIGLGVVFLSPIVLGLLSTVFPPVAILFAVYIMWLAVGFVMTGYALAVIVFKKDENELSGGMRFLFAVLGWFILFIITMIPILGAIMCIAALIFGSGAYLGALFGMNDEGDASLAPTAEGQDE